MKKMFLLSIILLISIISYSQIIEKLGTWEYGPTEAIAVKDSTAYISSGSYLWVLDISDESNPILIDEIKLENYINYIRRIGNYLYITKEDTLLNIYDIHTSNNPILVNQLEGYYKWSDLTIYDDTLYLGTQDGGTRQHFINDTINPQYIRWIWYSQILRRYSNIGICFMEEAIATYDLTRTGNLFFEDDYITCSEVIRGSAINYPYVYFGYGSEGIGVAKIINVDTIIEQGSYLTGGSTYDVELIEDTIMIAARGLNGIGIYDVDNDTIFTLIGECDIEGYAFELEVIGDRLFVGARSGGLQIINISDKNNPILLGEYRSYSECRGLYAFGDRLYVAGGEGGLNIFDISDGANISLIKQFYSRWISENVVVDNSYAYMAEGDSGLTIIDISNENNPIIVGDCDIRYFCDQIEVKDSMCVIGGQKLVNEREGIAIIDISNKTSPIMIDSIMHDNNIISFDLVDTILHCIGDPITDRCYEIWDLSDMYNPIFRDRIKVIAFPFTDIVSDNNHTFISTLIRDTIIYYDVSNKDSIKTLGVIRTEPSGITMGYYSNYLFEIVNSPYKMYVYDCSDIMNPIEEGIYNINNYADDIVRNNNYIYISQGGGFSGGNLLRGRFGLKIFGFNPTGIEDKQIYTKQENITITSTFKSININNQTERPQQYQLMDITGRIINTIEAKSGITVITPKRSGVYFIVDEDDLEKKKCIIIR